MSERIRQHDRSSKDPSGLMPETFSRRQRNFIDPVILAADGTTYADALTAFGIFAGIGIAAAGGGIGAYFFLRGRAEEIRAERGELKIEVGHTRAPRRTIPEE